MAKEAGVDRLIITHYPAEFAAGDLVDEARATFEGEIAVADDHLAYRIV